MAAIALATLCAGCNWAEQESPFRPQPKGRTFVETYPPPIDPALRPPRVIPPPVAPVIIDNGNKSTVIYTCRYARCETLKEAIDTFASPEGTVQASPALNVLLISDAKDYVPSLLKMTQELDRPMPQLLVEAKIVEIEMDSDFEYEVQEELTKRASKGLSDFVQTTGILLTTPSTGTPPNPTEGGMIRIRPIATDSSFLDLFLRLLITRGNAKILSSPNLIVGTGTEASIITGEEVPIQSATVVSGSVSTTTVFKRVGIKLRVTPLQISGDTAKVDVNPEVSTVVRNVSGGPGIENPVIGVRNVRSIVNMKDGQILTVGGLLSTEDHKTVKKVPWLGDLPGVGVMFQSWRVTTTRKQLVFFLRVNILPDSSAHDLDYHRPGAGMDNLEDVSPVRTSQPATEPALWPVPTPRVINLSPATEPAGLPLPTSRPSGSGTAVPPVPPGEKPRPPIGVGTPPAVIDETPEPKVIDDVVSPAAVPGR
jgi:hypothetical protein